MPDKNHLRRNFREMQPLPPDVRAEKSARICDAIRFTEPWRSALAVAIFAPLPGEPDVEMLWDGIGNRTFSYPRVDGDWLALHTVRSLHELRSGQWGLREPIPDPATLVAPDSIDLILVPGVAFSRSGARLGRGRGYYDRLLSTLPAHVRKIGVCFDFQILPGLPTDPHDQAVDIVVAESGTIRAT